MRTWQIICSSIHNYLGNNLLEMKGSWSEDQLFFGHNLNYFPIFAAVYHEAYHQNADYW